MREPDFIVGEDDYTILKRWYLIPRNRFFNIYLHQFVGDDEKRALHDHPWASCSIVIKGGYVEHLPNSVMKHRRVGGIYFRKATQAHRIELYTNPFPFCRNFGKIPAWTIFITGPKIREWGFHCPKGWRHHLEFCDPTNHGKIGRGCE